jgi:hypothetical protein
MHKIIIDQRIARTSECNESKSQPSACGKVRTLAFPVQSEGKHDLPLIAYFVESKKEIELAVMRRREVSKD